LVRIWDTATGELIHLLPGHTASVYAVAFSRDPAGSRLFSGGVDGALRIWDPVAGEMILEIPTGSGIWGIAVSCDETVATSGHDGNVRIWETKQPTPMLRWKRRLVVEARELVEARTQSNSLEQANESLFSDETIEPELKGLALDILRARQELIAEPQVTGER
jgi:WD40 repeat protein